MVSKNCSILLLKESPSPTRDAPSEQPRETSSHAADLYTDALHSAFSRHQPNVVLKVEYLPPMTTLFPKTTLLSRAILSGYPPGHSSNMGSEFGCLWAFAVTSQNAVHAVEAALQHQPDTGTYRECVSPELILLSLSPG